MKKLISVILSISILILTFAGCTSEQTAVTQVNSENQDTIEEVVSIKLAYSKNDSLNPYSTETVVNNQITALVYDGLFRLDSSYKPQPVIADSATVNGNTINLTLKNVFFSDGTQVTINDINYSLEKARESEVYSTRVENIEYITNSTSSILMIKLFNNDPYAISCLDFPIIKSGSDENFPIGSGRYKYIKEGENINLTVNLYKEDFNPEINKIILEAVHQSDSAASSLSIGNTAIYYDDLSSGTYTRSNANNIDMGINNLVYIGFDAGSPFFADSRVRQAVSLCVDREKISTYAFCAHSRPTSSPFNPDWYEVSAYPSDNVVNKEKALELIEEAGVVPESGEVVILCNGENGFKLETANAVEESLESLGFIVRVQSVTEDDFVTQLQTGYYDIYIGEVKLPKNMDISSLFSGSASYGIAYTSSSAEMYNTFRDGDCEIMDFLNTFNTDMPFVPLCYRNAVVSYTNSIGGNFGCCDSDIFYDIDSWSID